MFLRGFKASKCIWKATAVMKIFIWGGISSVLRSEISFYDPAPTPDLSGSALFAKVSVLVCRDESITKTSLFKCTENFTTKKWKKIR